MTAETYRGWIIQGPALPRAEWTAIADDPSRPPHSAARPRPT